ncbi:lipoate--protein ligase family protein [bacterium]|nr:lipoate--protein ligase family protein [bacterium]MCB2179368.1 lipoate--protein ligase family protein [bacterium]
MTETNTLHWRLIYSAPAPGAWNMAVDEAILEAATRGDVPPTLRFYAWNPPCLSLGYAQPINDVDRANLQTNGWDMVRRPTGGRAILHTDELTYSVSGPDTDPVLVGDILSSYRRISGAILAALAEIGLGVQAQPKEGSGPNKQPAPVCFEVPSNYEITAGGKKLVGSAQARRRGGVLQHGTLPLYGDLTRIVQALVFPDEQARQTAAERLLARATTVETSLNKVITWEEAARAFEKAFRETLQLDLTPGELSPAELARAEELMAEKYANPDWTERV